MTKSRDDEPTQIQSIDPNVETKILFRKDVFAYDERGNISENVVENDDRISKFIYKYELDQRGNWIKRTITGETKFKPGKFQSDLFEQSKPNITTRVTTYY